MKIVVDIDGKSWAVNSHPKDKTKVIITAPDGEKIFIKSTVIDKRSGPYFTENLRNFIKSGIIKPRVMKRNDTRTLDINGETWEYKIGKTLVSIYSPDGKKYCPKRADVWGISPSTVKQFILDGIISPKFDVVKTWEIKYIPKSTNIDEGVCKYCGDKGLTVELRTNPYRQELCGDDSLHYICDSCRHQLCQDI